MAPRPLRSVALLLLLLATITVVACGSGSTDGSDVTTSGSSSPTATTQPELQWPIYDLDTEVTELPIPSEFEPLPIITTDDKLLSALEKLPLKVDGRSRKEPVDELDGFPGTFLIPYELDEASHLNIITVIHVPTFAEDRATNTESGLHIPLDLPAGQLVADDLLGQESRELFGDDALIGGLDGNLIWVHTTRSIGVRLAWGDINGEWYFAVEATTDAEMAHLVDALATALESQ
jgi:hypothetical protein